MKYKKIISVLLSTAICMSLVAAPVSVIADETAVPSETQSSESKDDTEPKESVNPKEKKADKDSSAPKETEAPKQTEAPKETTAPKETELPKETEPSKETEAPKETELPEETEITKETEAPKESEPAKEPEESKETEVPKETEPTETETPKESVPQETEEPKETEPEDTPTERVPEETDKKAPKSGLATINASISDGVLSWDDVDGVYLYDVLIGDHGYSTEYTSINLNSFIDRLIKNKFIEKASSYSVRIVAYDEDYDEIAIWSGTYNYESSTVPIEVGEIQNVAISNGIITWNAYNNADYYELRIAGRYADSVSECSFELNDKIDRMIRARDINKSDSYKVVIYAFDSDDAKIAECEVNHTYNSSADPIEVGTLSARISNGILSWDAYAGAVKYEVWVEDCQEAVTVTTFGINDDIDYLIKDNQIRKSSPYSISVLAINDDGDIIAEWNFEYEYNSSSSPVTEGVLSNVKFQDGTVSWDPFEGATDYWIAIGEEFDCSQDETSYDIDHFIDTLIRDSKIVKNSPYSIEIYAQDEDGIVLARWSGTYSYESSANPVEVGTIANVKFANGTMSWAEYEDAAEYSILIAENDAQRYLDTNSLEINKEIDKLIKEGSIRKNSPYSLTLFAYDVDGVTIAKWTGSYTYNSSANPVAVGTIASVNFANGTLSWDPYNGAVSYEVTVYDSTTGTNDETSLSINDLIDELIRYGDIEKNSPYPIRIAAYDEDDVLIAEWSGTYAYESSAGPIEVEPITNVKFSNGVMTWDAYKDYEDYSIEVSDGTNEVCYPVEGTSFELDKFIFDCIESDDLKFDNFYTVKIKAYESVDVVIAEWSGTYTYRNVLGSLNASISSEGVISWKVYEGAYRYKLTINGNSIGSDVCPEWFDSDIITWELNNEIDHMIKLGTIEKKSPYSIEVVAVSTHFQSIASWSGTYSYESPANLIEIGTVSNVVFSDEKVTWDPYKNASSYRIVIYGDQDSSIPLCFLKSSSCDISELKRSIDVAIKGNQLKKADSYLLGIEAYEAAFFDNGQHDYLIAKWTGSYAYSSSAEPITVGKINAKITDGILTWEHYNYPNVKYYSLCVFGATEWYEADSAPFSLNLNDTIDDMLRRGRLEKHNSYEIQLNAFDDQTFCLATWSHSYSYNSPVTPLVIGTISNVSFSDGVMTWDAYKDANIYVITIEDKYTYMVFSNSISFNINHEIDLLIKAGKIVKNNTYNLSLNAQKSSPNDALIIAKWDGTYDYDSSANPIVVGTLTNVKIDDGILSWDAYPNTGYYSVTLNSSGPQINTPSFELNKYIDRYVKAGTFNKSYTYSIKISAYDSDRILIAKTEFEYQYDSPCDPIQVGTIDATLSDNGDLEWKRYEGAENYTLRISRGGGYTFGDVDLNSVNVKKNIQLLIEDNRITNTGLFLIELTAYDSDNLVIAEWSQDFKYDPTKDISLATVTGIENVSYTGGVITQNPVVVLFGDSLIKDKDYSVSYKNNVKVGTATVTITGIGSYNGELSMNFDIKTVDISNATVSGIEDKTFTGAEITQDFLVNLNGSIFVKDRDYTILYMNNINVGTASIIITGKDNCTGGIIKTFIINNADISNASVTGIEDKSYTSVAVTQNPTVSYNGKTLGINKDYVVSYKDNISSGTATLIITGRGSFKGEIRKTFKINTIDINSAQINGIKDMPYVVDGVELLLDITLNENKLVQGTDYNVSYENNYKLGTAKVTITGIGSCTGTFSATFNIVQAPNTLTVKPAKTTSLKYSKLKKKKQLVSLAKVISLSNTQGRVTYKLVSAKKAKSKKSFKKYFKVNASSGIVTVKKKLKKGTYTLTCVVTATGNENYKRVNKTVAIKIKVK